MGRHFDKVLVANRGEMACRIFTTCRRLGIRTVAVFSDADARARHVGMADEAVYVGPSPAAESYLRGDVLIEACKATGAQAVHPGSGFLSENANFADSLEAHNIAFVGPPGSVLRLMGDKLHAKEVARQAGLSCIPSTPAPTCGSHDVKAFAQRVGYPVLIKACGGGGGKGIRLVTDDDACDALYRLCEEEARLFFADATLLAEKALERARHVEVQVLADRHGHIACFPERECSIQRRNQKVIEESPSPLFDSYPELRARAMAFARAVAHEADYVSAGTVEFMVTPHDHQIYFLEVNPRLQVEHTVTEMVTGCDLVEQMLRIAAGLPMSVDPARTERCRGHATEVRVHAEDPLHNYAPSTGRLVEYAEPHLAASDNARTRCDSGVCAGSVVSLYYDPLLCKMCAWGADRAASLTRMTASLDALVLRGVHTNVNLAYRVLESPEYVNGKLHTCLLDNLPLNVLSLSCGEERLVSQVMACLRFAQELSLHALGPGAAASIGAATFNVTVRRSDNAASTAPTVHTVTVHAAGSGLFLCESEDVGPVEVALTPEVDSPVVAAVVRRQCMKAGHAQSLVLQYFGTADELHHDVTFKGAPLVVGVYTPLQHTLLQGLTHSRASTTRTLKGASVVPLRAAMPGLLVELCVKEGDRVQAGEEVATAEAMKMRSKLCSPCSGVVQRVHASVGAAMRCGDAILEILPS